MGHAAAYSPMAKHRFEERCTKSVGPLYRYRNYGKHIVVVSDPVLQHEVRSHGLLSSCFTPWGLHTACTKHDAMNELQGCPATSQVLLGLVTLAPITVFQIR